MKSILFKSTIVLLLLAAAAGPLGAGVPQNFMLVRIINPHPFPVQVHSQTFNPYGRSQWVMVTTVSPQSYADIPNVPVGAVLGVNSPQQNRSWPPFQVVRTSPYASIFNYRVPD